MQHQHSKCPSQCMRLVINLPHQNFQRILLKWILQIKSFESLPVALLFKNPYSTISCPEMLIWKLKRKIISFAQEIPVLNEFLYFTDQLNITHLLPPSSVMLIYFYYVVQWNNNNSTSSTTWTINFRIPFLFFSQQIRNFSRKLAVRFYSFSLPKINHTDGRSSTTNRHHPWWLIN